jgi:hypothetical protein
MHKTVHGQVTILPSRSLLVDFREGERRRGKKGDQVFVADPDGAKVIIIDFYLEYVHSRNRARSKYTMRRTSVRHAA